MFNWLKSLFGIKPTMNESVWQSEFTSKQVSRALDKQAPKKRPRLYKQAVVVTKGELPKPARKAPVKKAPAKKVAVKKPVTKGKK